MQTVTAVTGSNQKSVFWWEKAFAVAGLLLSTGAVLRLLREESGAAFNPVQGDMIIQGLWSGIYMITFFLLLPRFRQVVRIAFQDKFLWLLVGLALVSILWSVAPGMTLRRSVALLGTTVFGIYLASRYSRQELLTLLVWTLGLSAVLSLGFALLLPSHGVHHNLPHLGAWRGIYVNKNVLGRLMALAALVGLMVSFSNHRGRVAGLVFFGVSVEILFLSTSKTALAVFFTLLLLLLIHLYRMGHRRTILPVLLIVLTLLLFNWFGTASPTRLPEADATLTGRTHLWQAVWEMIRQKPWLGYGQGAFWLNWNGPSSDIWNRFDWKPPDAHNFYLDLWLQLGLVGLAAFAFSLFTSLFKALALARKKDGLDGMLPLLLLAAMLMYGITDSAVLVQNSFYWILYVVISIQLRTEHGKGEEGRT